MNSATYFSDLIIQGIGITLLHSVWQGLLIAIILTLASYLIPKTNVQLKYWLSVTALTGVIFWAGYTFSQQVLAIDTTALDSESSALGVSLTLSGIPLAKAGNLFNTESLVHLLESSVGPYTSTIVTLWVVGVIFFLIRLQGSLFYLRKLRTVGCQPVPIIWQQKTAQLMDRMGIAIPVKLVESKLADVPMVIGHLKPVVLIPFGMLTGLTVKEVEAILAHELAHIKRYDYLINIVQTLVESLLFFNPAVWWISHLIRKNREHCCDDIAVRYCGNQLIYANALSNLGAWSLKSPVLGMGLFKNQNELLMRIKRLVYPQGGNRTVREKLIPGIVLAMTVLFLSWYSLKVQAQLAPMESIPVDSIVLVQQHPVITPADSVPEIEVEVAVEVPVEAEVAVSPDVDVVIEVDTVGPEFEFHRNFGEFEPDVFVFPPAESEGVFVMPPDTFHGLAEIPDVFVYPPDGAIDIDAFIEMDELHGVLNQLQIKFNDTTRERIMAALEEQREALEQAMEEQAMALEKARDHLQKSLEAERPEELTEEEWELAKQQIEEAERSLERTLKQSERALEDALEGHSYDVHRHIDKIVKENVDRNRIVLKQVVRADQERIKNDIARAHKYAKRYRYRMSNDEMGNEAELRRKLVKDGLIDDYDADISISFTKTQIKINGVKLEGDVKEQYRALLDEMYGENSTGSLTFSN